MLAKLKKYEDENQSLTDALNEIKDLKNDLENKNAYIKDLINVVNKLEMLNSYQEMEIITLRYLIIHIHASFEIFLSHIILNSINYREKLGIPEDESVSIEHALAKRREQEKKMEELLQQNKLLIEENLELKSDVRNQ